MTTNACCRFCGVHVPEDRRSIFCSDECLANVIRERINRLIDEYEGRTWLKLTTVGKGHHEMRIEQLRWVLRRMGQSCEEGLHMERIARQITMEEPDLAERSSDEIDQALATPNPLPAMVEALERLHGLVEAAVTGWLGALPHGDDLSPTVRTDQLQAKQILDKADTTAQAALKLAKEER